MKKQLILTLFALLSMATPRTACSDDLLRRARQNAFANFERGFAEKIETAGNYELNEQNSADVYIINTSSWEAGISYLKAEGSTADKHWKEDLQLSFNEKSATVSAKNTSGCVLKLGNSKHLYTTLMIEAKGAAYSLVPYKKYAIDFTSIYEEMPSKQGEYIYLIIIGTSKTGSWQVHSAILKK